MDAPPVAAPPAGRRRYDPAWRDWNAPRRWPGIALTCVIVLAFVGVVVWHFRPHATPAKSTVHLPALQPCSARKSGTCFSSAFVPGTAGHEVLTTFRGTKDRTGLRFTSNGQLLVLHAGCLCAYNFVVEVSSSLDQPIAFPVNTNGHYNSVLNATMPAGTYSLSVIGSGPWVVQLIQPTAGAPAIATPFQYFSSGNDVLGPFSSANLALHLRFLSGTNGSVYVHVLNGAGVRIATPFEGRFAVKRYALLNHVAGLSNPYYLEVDASGYWDLQVARSAGT